MKPYKIFISDKFDSRGIASIKKHSDLFTLEYDNGHNRDAFLKTLPLADALVVRSATKVDKEAIDCATNLKIIIRAGVGIDNIDVIEASKRGIFVENAPGGNSISTAEQALALIFATARYTPQAYSSIMSGKWEKSKFKGLEITGKTLGVVGLGRIGKEVVTRARGLQMEVIGYDPYMSAESLEHLNIEIVEKEDLLKRSDFITVHTPLTESTKDFIAKKNLSSLKDGVILINAARGGIYNEDALVEGLSSRKIRAVGLDVYSQEPLVADSPLRSLENCIMTPHLGASTSDAEYAVAMETISGMTDFFQNGIIRNSFNFPSVDSEAARFLKPYSDGGIRVAKWMALETNEIDSVHITYSGEITQYKTDIVTASIKYGLLLPALGEKVNLVNAASLIESRGLQVTSSNDPNAKTFSSSVQLQVRDSKQVTKEVKYTSFRNEALVFSLFDLALECRPEGLLLSIKNSDTPGVVGTIGSFLGEKGINIAHLELKRENRGDVAFCIISIDERLGDEQMKELANLENILEVKQIDLR